MVDEVEHQWAEASGLNRTVGVVSPFRPQANLITKLLSARRPDLVTMTTVDTAHGFQGAERDVMVFSPVLADGIPPGLVAFAGTSNLVNVTVTRARARLVIVGSRRHALSSKTVLADLAQTVP